MSIRYDYAKMAPERRIRRETLDLPPSQRRNYLLTLMDKAKIPSEKMVVCSAAFDLGHKEIAKEHVPKIDVPISLITVAKSLLASSADLDFVLELTSQDFRHSGQLHKRPGRLFELIFTDGKIVFCKSRNVRQESLGYDLLQLAGLPIASNMFSDSWIVIEGIRGKTLGDYAFLPELAGPVMDPISYYSKVVAVSAFDYVFGTLDRNEKGMIVSNNHQNPYVIDHEYLLIGSGQSILTARQLGLYRSVLKECSKTTNHFSSDLTILDNLDDARAVFFNLHRNKAAVIDRIVRHITVNPVVCLFSGLDIPISGEALEQLLMQVSRKIQGGPDEFGRIMVNESRKIRSTAPQIPMP